MRQRWFEVRASRFGRYQVIDTRTDRVVGPAHYPFDRAHRLAHVLNGPPTRLG